MKRILICFLFLGMILSGGSAKAIEDTKEVQTTNVTNYKILPGDSLWKICSKFQVGVPEVIALNPQLSNPNNIYPGTIIKIPNLDATKLVENQVITLVNAERSKVGAPALKANWQLGRVARTKAEDMRDKNYFSHTSPTYGSPFDMMKKFGISFTTAGENIAQGQKTPAEVMTSWMNSPGHRQNILNSGYGEIGVGFAKNAQGTTYWVQQFIHR